MKVLVVAPHADDETIGMGGTIAKHALQGDEVTLAVMTGKGPGSHPLYADDAWDQVRSECRAAAKLMKISNLVFEEIPALLAADQPAFEINKITSQILQDTNPDVVYVPFPFDLHSDHRAIFDSMSVAWRPTSPAGKKTRAIYCYETQSETHWNAPYIEAGFLPTHYVDISETIEVKQAALACYQSQMHEPPDTRSIEAILALAKWRGSLIGVHAAEAFVTIRTLG